MDPVKRQVEQYLWDPELTAGKMVFLAGPRQVGKTTYARGLLESGGPGAYFNWDNPLVRAAHRRDPFFFLDGRKAGGRFLVVFDEIHKRHRWKDILKGIYDTVDRDCRFLVTGSARLELFRRSGDSLVGRHMLFHLLPLSSSEIAGTPLARLWLGRPAEWKNPWAALLRRLDEPLDDRAARQRYEGLFHWGGFPEPYFRASDRFLRKWKADYLSLLLSEDLRDLTGIRAVDIAEKIALLLPERVGSPLSIAALGRDVEASFPTVKNHLLQLRKLWLLFSIRPYCTRLTRAVRREEKWYFVNWTYAADEARVFENLVAAGLHRACLVWTDCGFGRAELWHVRNFDGVEIDFLVTLDGKPALAVEAKTSDPRVAAPALRLAGRLPAPYLQVVHRPGIHLRPSERCRVVSADRLLAVLP